MTERLLAGLCSITFRQLAPAEILRIASEAGVEAIEWGSDVHLPPGDVGLAERLARSCADSSIACLSYGSYLVAGNERPVLIGTVLETAVALGADAVRIWTPMGVGPDAPFEERQRVAEGVGEVADAAAVYGLAVALEFHPGTLTHTAASTNQLMEMVGRENVFTYWQPIGGAPSDNSLEEFRAVIPNLAHLHVFNWDASGGRHPLAEAEDLWHRVLKIASAPGRWGRVRVAYLEHVAVEPDQFLRDSGALRRWLAEAEFR